MVQESLRAYFIPNVNRRGNVAEKIGPNLHNPDYRRVYAQAWEEAIENADSWESLARVLSLGYDPHQFKGNVGTAYIDPRKDPLYSDARRAACKKAKELDPSKGMRTIESMMVTFHPDPYRVVHETYTEYVESGWGPFRKRTPVEKPHERRVLKPLEELFSDLEAS